MLIGGDTGLFLGVTKGYRRAQELWSAVVAGEHELVLSVLSAHEILHYFYRIGKPASGAEWSRLLRTLPNIRIEPVTLVIAEKAAGYRHGLGMSTVDSVILATFVETDCELAVTADADFRAAADQKIVTLEILRD